VVWIVMLSFKSPAALSDKRFIPEDFSTENYDFIINGPGSDLFLPALRNSFGICLIATFIAVILSMFCAYAIARLGVPREADHPDQRAGGRDLPRDLDRDAAVQPVA
jgi:multiple sugar transport system permease protein